MSTDKSLQNIRIILVEDDAHIARIYSKFFVKAGANVLLVHDGEQALRKLREEAVDVVLLDLGMPGMDGYETLTAIRSDPKTNTLPVVILSNTTIDRQHGQGAELYEAGISGVCRKYETSLQELLSVVHSACRESNKHLLSV